MPEEGKFKNKYRISSARLKGYDYAQAGFYFVTICVKDRIECFGEIKNGEMILNKYGYITEKQWQWLADQYLYVKLDDYVVMSNHVHGILVIDFPVGTGRNLSLQSVPRDLSLPKLRRDQTMTGRDLSLPSVHIKSLSDLMGAFKTTSSKLIHQSGFVDFAWQRSFYDHIIRTEKSLYKIRRYIYYNPLKWELDRNNQENLLM
jgi:REP element-mobilizing transposase RayT